MVACGFGVFVLGTGAIARIEYGGSTMTSTRGKWLRSSLAALVILVAPASTSTVWAQGGYGADPFKPYNSQYDPYTYPMATPDVGPGSGGMPRMGNQGANQYQNYLDELSGADRQGNERYGIGVPYYRSSIDPSFDPKGDREYRPNSKMDRTYEHTQEVITRKYLAYFAEKDPKKRTELLKDYNRTRSNVSRAMSTARREDPARALEEATADDFGERRSRSPARRDDALSGTADGKPRPAPAARRPTRPLPTADGARGGAGLIPPPPPLYPGGDGRATIRRRRPSDVLDRSRRLNSGSDVQPNPGARTGPGGGAARRSVPAVPSPE
jgi:hypothetical protein